MLVLSTDWFTALITGKPENSPRAALLDFQGNKIDDLNFKFGTDTNAEMGCSATLNGEHWVFGGYDGNPVHNTQVSFYLTQNIYGRKYSL